MASPQPKPKAAKNGLDPDSAPPLLKTCVMCRTRKVKCGSEKPSCINCVKYRCKCVYLPSARHMRGKSQPSHQPIASMASSTAKPLQKHQKHSHPFDLATSGTEAPIPVSAILKLSTDSLPSPSSPLNPAAKSTNAALAPSRDGLSQSQLMKPVSHSTHSTQTDRSSETPPHLLPLVSSAASKLSLSAFASTSELARQQATIPSNLSDGTLGHHDAGLAYWRTLPPPPQSSLPPNHPQCRQTSSEHSLTSGITDAIRGISLPPSSEAPSVDSHSHIEPIERGSSIAPSSSGFGSPSITYSPSFINSGIDPKLIEASLPTPVPDSIDNMLKAYFRYQYPSSGVVLEEFFWFRYRRNMLTPLIIYAMLAVAAWNIASDDNDVKYANIHETFYRMAKQYVEDAMDEAHLRSVQGLLVLSNYEALVGRWGTMWNHTTMARRLAEGIIFRDTDFPWVDVQRDEFDFEYQRVRRAYWHSVINDIWACVLMDKQIGGIEIALPPKPTYDFTYRYIRLLPSESAPGYQVALGPEALQDPKLGNTAASSELYLLIGGINNAAYLFQHGGRPPLFETFIDYEMRLTNWYLNLPETVRLDNTTISRFTATPQRADLGEIISTHIFWNFARLLLMKMGLVLSLREDPGMVRNIYGTKAFYTTDSRALQFYQSAMPILTPDKAASYDEWLFHFCRCMSLQSAQNVVNLLKLGERHNVHPGHFGAGLSLPLVQVVSVSLGLVRSPDPQVVQIAVDHLTTVIRTLLRLKHWFNTALLLLHLFLAMQDPQLILPDNSIFPADEKKCDADTLDALKAIESLCPFPSAHLITELMRRLHMTFEDFVKEIIQAVRMSSPTKNRVDPCISPLLRHLPAQSQAALMYGGSQEPDWFKYAPGYLRSAWKRLVRAYKPVPARPDDPIIATSGT
ncbi:hypothetical protein GGI25_003436 [Coemansia spiralis]|uniref:Zn(2)-C6 fungal-type domain-containing protein n=2 Tax=Coemansia TaxID=4863 RepID=A0A9W8G230_9FUNG|nr:hypothetical protein BX070DRAFT_3353 [Coemansia spiralis]KAJ1994253.1 hypothetical protein EDC05_001695 [Coemansia umbellata]KAJ2621244.1 hypothetical protein GGI26_004317 [Coemansia sp. RSA 1358]KAJ2676791.1 hypothetical protein GGI25_003436 [Coemansia spiralis]